MDLTFTNVSDSSVVLFGKTLQPKSSTKVPARLGSHPAILRLLNSGVLKGDKVSPLGTAVLKSQTKTSEPIAQAPQTSPETTPEPEVAPNTELAPEVPEPAPEVPEQESTPSDKAPEEAPQESKKKGKGKKNK